MTTTATGGRSAGSGGLAAPIDPIGPIGPVPSADAAGQTEQTRKTSQAAGQETGQETGREKGMATAAMTTTQTTSWGDFEAAEPGFAATVRERFKAFRHHVLATLRADGSPRVSGIETSFLSGELWLGSMPGARKVRDLLRDPRFALHANPGPGTDMHGGDVRVSGLALHVTEPAVIARFAEELQPPLPFDLFRVDVREVVRISLDGDDLVTQTWRPDGRGVRVLRRGSDDSPPREG